MNFEKKLIFRRISNGFIVTNNEGREMFYRSLTHYVDDCIKEQSAEYDEYFHTHNADGEELAIELKVSQIDKEITK